MYKLRICSHPSVSPGPLVPGMSRYDLIPEGGFYTWEMASTSGYLIDDFSAYVVDFSTDSFVQDATSTQAYNRYSYALNNPLKYTDPDGESVMGGLNTFLNIISIPGRLLSAGTASLNDAINGNPHSFRYWSPGYLFFGRPRGLANYHSNFNSAGAVNALMATGANPFVDASGMRISNEQITEEGWYNWRLNFGKALARSYDLAWNKNHSADGQFMLASSSSQSLTLPPALFGISVAMYVSVPPSTYFRDTI